MTTNLVLFFLVSFLHKTPANPPLQRLPPKTSPLIGATPVPDNPKSHNILLLQELRPVPTCAIAAISRQFCRTETIYDIIVTFAKSRPVPARGRLAPLPEHTLARAHPVASQFTFSKSVLIVFAAKSSSTAALSQLLSLWVEVTGIIEFDHLFGWTQFYLIEYFTCKCSKSHSVKDIA